MAAEDEKKVLEEVFGESSSSSTSSDSDSDSNPEINQSSSPSTSIPSPTWARIQSVDGLWLCTHFLSPPQQSSLLSSIHNEGWFTEESHNQAMRFGDLPSWAVKLSDQIYEALCIGGEETDTVTLCSDNEGICAHVDLMRFEDGIAIVSLESSCVMHFSPVERDKEDLSPTTKIPVYLTPGSLVIMSGEARYHWKHEINRKPGFQVWEGQDLEQNRRTSITLRKLCIYD